MKLMERFTSSVVFLSMYCADPKILVLWNSHNNNQLLLEDIIIYTTTTMAQIITKG